MSKAQPSAALIPHHVDKWTTQAIHASFGGLQLGDTACMGIVLILFGVALMLATVMHLCTHIHIATPTPYQKYCMVMSFLSLQGSAKAKQAFCTIAYFTIERGLSAAHNHDS